MDRIYKIYFIVSLLATSCNSKSLRIEKPQEICDSHQRISDCEILALLSDSTVWKKHILTKACLNTIIKKIRKTSKIDPNWFCDYGGCDYLNYSMEKSLFKVDVVKWMLFFKCPNVSKIKANTKGNFTQEEINLIKAKEKVGIKIDTTILY